MEIKQAAQLVQLEGVTADRARHPRVSSTVRSPRRARATWLGTALVAMGCTAAVVTASIAPIASGSTLRRDEHTVTNNVVNSELGHLRDTVGIAAGTFLGMENFLRDYPATTPEILGDGATSNAVNAELWRMHETGGIAAGTMLGVENFLRVFPATAVAKSDPAVVSENRTNAQLGRLHETEGIGLGTVLGMENLLRVSPVTA